MLIPIVDIKEVDASASLLRITDSKLSCLTLNFEIKVKNVNATRSKNTIPSKYKAVPQSCQLRI